METSTQSFLRLALAVASVSILLVAPILAFAAPRSPNVPDGRAIFERVIARLCEFQAARGNRVILVDPARCAPPPPAASTLTLWKTVVNDNSGTATTTDFQAKIDGTNVAWGVAQTVSAGAHSASEVTLPGYGASAWGGDCSVSGTTTLAAGENKNCTITNDDVAQEPIAPTLTVTKVVVNDNGGTATTSDFTLFIDGATTTSGVASTTTTGAHIASEGSHAGYGATIGGDCDANGNVTLAAGENKTCTITNDDNPPQSEGRLLITEVLYDLTTSTTSPQGDEPANEWVEIHNGTTADISLAGYFIHDASSADALPSVVLPAGKFGVITGSSTTATFWSVPADAMWIVLANTTIGNGLANGGDAVWLESAASTTVDAVNWGTDTSAFSPSVPTVTANSGSSITRTSPSTDTGTAADWTANSTPNPGL